MFFNRAIDEHMIWLLKPSIESREDGVRRRSGNVRLADHLMVNHEEAACLVRTELGLDAA